MTRGERINKKQIELLYNKYAPPNEASLNIVEVDKGEMMVISIIVRPEEIPAFLDAVAEFERFYRLPMVGDA